MRKIDAFKPFVPSNDYEMLKSFENNIFNHLKITYTDEREKRQ